MNSKLKWSIASVAALTGVAAFVPWTVGAPSMRAELAQQTQRATGLQASAAGRVRIRLLPRPRIDFEDVAIGDDDDAIHLRAPRLRADLRLPPLLIGRLQFASVTLQAPEIVVDPAGFKPEQASVLSRASAAPAQTQEARKADRARLGAVSLRAGRLTLRGGAESAVITDIDARIDWQSPGAPATIVGQLAWRGERAEIEALVGKPAELMRGERSPFTLKLDSRTLDLTLDGAVAGGARWLVEARLASSSERLRALLAALDVRPPLPGRLARAALSGQLRALPQTTTLSDLSLTVDGNVFDGSMALRLREGRPLLSGTLATRAFELAPNELGAPPLRGPDRQWSRDWLPAPRLDLFDADMRISAAKARVGRLALTDVGVMMAVTDGKLDVTLAGAELYGGRIKGRFAISGDEKGLELRAAGGFANVDAGAFLRDVTRMPRLYGVATGEFQAQSSGASVAALVQQLAGAARLSVLKGEIVGIDIEQALRRAEKRPLSIASQVRTGQTAFQTADVELGVSRGVISLERARVVGLGAEMVVTGRISAVDRMMRLSIAASPPRPAATPVALSGDNALLNLDLVGSWEEPILSLDAESLIRRSPAAAPLLRRPASAEEPASEAP